jgi:hypothetical protein
MIWLGVSGAHRSGTTILAQILNLHPEIGIFVEYGLEQYVKAIDAVFDRSDEIEAYDSSVDERRAAAARMETKSQSTSMSAAKSARSPVKTKTSKERKDPLPVPLSKQADAFYADRDTKLGLDSLGPFRPVRQSHGDRMLLSAYRMVFPKRKLRVVGDKMPHFGDKSDVDWLSRRLPNFKLLHIVRNPLDVINSSLARRNKTRAGTDIWHVSTVKEAAEEWVREWNWALAAKRRLGDSMLIVRYEDIAADPQAVLADIGSFLDLTTPLAPAFIPLPGDLRLYALDDSERDLALAWFQPLASIWGSTPWDHLQRRVGELPRLALPNEPILFQQDGNSSDYVWSGFSTPETEGKWTVEKVAEIRCNYGFDRQQCRLDVRLKAIAYCRKVVVRVNDRVIGTLDMGSPTWDDREFSIDFEHPAADLTGTRLSFEIDRPKLPEEDPAQDQRTLGIFLQSVTLKALDQPSKSSTPVL